MRIQVCTPTYIEAENIEEFLRRARAALPEADILVLDDNSPDGTADIAERVGAELGQIEVLRRPEKRGLGNAYRAGFAIGIAPPGTYREPMARSAPAATAAMSSGRTSGSCDRSASIWQITSYPRAMPIANPAR